MIVANKLLLLIFLWPGIFFREIVEAMQDADAGIPLDLHMSSKDNKAHKLCFTGRTFFANNILIIKGVIKIGKKKGTRNTCSDWLIT